jgi:hypothetical protein
MLGLLQTRSQSLCIWCPAASGYGGHEVTIRGSKIPGWYSVDSKARTCCAHRVATKKGTQCCCNTDSRSLRMGGAFSTAVKPNSVVVPVVSDPCAFCSQYRQRLCFACTRASAAAPKPFLDPQLLITSSRDYNDAMSQCLLLWLAAYRAAATRASHRDKDKIFCHRVCNRSFVRIDRHCEKQLGRASCW